MMKRAFALRTPKIVHAPVVCLEPILNECARNMRICCSGAAGRPKFVISGRDQQAELAAQTGTGGGARSELQAQKDPHPF